MSITNVPPYVMHCVAKYLETEDLELLFTTFDRRIQKMLATPDLLVFLRISAINTGLPWPRIYFLRSVRNVYRLELPDRLKWPIRLFPLIATLNPVELTLIHDQSNKKIECKLKAEAKRGKTTKASRFWTNFGQPNFRRLTPRLQTLELAKFPTKVDVQRYVSNKDFNYESGCYYLFANTARLSFPKSLTSLVLDEKSHGFLACITGLPKTLRYLSVSFHELRAVNFHNFFQRFPCLESLHLINPTFEWDRTEPVTTYPNSLTSLSFTVKHVRTVLDFFHRIDPIASSLTKMSISTSKSDDYLDEIHFACILPPSIRELEVMARSKSLFLFSVPGTNIASLPPNLTALSLFIGDQNASVLDLLYSLPLLRKIHLECKDRPIHLCEGDSTHLLKLAVPMLPSSLESLHVHKSYKVTPSTILSLPPNLTWLSLSSFDLDHLSTLRRHLPRCQVNVVKPFNLWSKSNGPKLRNSTFGPEWTSSVSMADWAPQLLVQCSKMGINIQSTLAADLRSSVPWVDHFSLDANNASVARLFHFNSDFPALLMLGLPHLQTLKLKTHIPYAKIDFSQLPSTLTHLDLDDPELIVDLCSPFTCSSLVHISTTSTLKGRRKDWALPKSLTFLDAPNWLVSHSAFSQWTLHNFERLVLHIVDIMDWQIPRLMSSKNFNAKTRFNMRLQISYGLSGLLLPSKAKYVSLSELESVTEKWLKSQLLATAPRDASLPLKTHSSALKDSISTYKWRNRLTTSSLFFPSAVRTAIIEYLSPWRLGSAHIEDTPFDNCFGVPSDISTLKNLTRLEVENPLPGAPIFSVLPPGLKFLRIKYDEMCDLGSTLPPKLEVLLIEQTLAWRTPFFKLSFALSFLPPTMVHLGIIANSFALMESDTDLNKLRLPKLETLYLVGLSLSESLLCHDRFPVASVEQVRILVLSSAELLGQRLIPIDAIACLHLNATYDDAKHCLYDFRTWIDLRHR